jgi:hypothetical protein
MGSVEIGLREARANLKEIKGRILIVIFRIITVNNYHIGKSFECQNFFFITKKGIISHNVCRFLLSDLTYFPPNN